MSADTAKKPAEATRNNTPGDTAINSSLGRTKAAKPPSSPCVLPIVEGRVSFKNDEKFQTAIVDTGDVLNPEKTFITGGNDFIPMDILNSLAKVPTPPTREQLGPPNKYKKLGRIENIPIQAKRKPANVWNYSKGRDKFKHLTEQPPCLCGAGRDISFLYDAMTSQEKSKQSREKDQKGNAIVKISREEKEKTKPSEYSEEFTKEYDKDSSKPDQIEPRTIPSTIVPSEYHIVKNPGVMGLEFYDDKYSTYVENHEDHLTVFPSMVPSGRQEVMKLKHSVDAMLSRAGVDDEVKELTGPTQIHNLLELVKKEQNIYNICFNEIIRQVTVDCAERGELLASLRKRYAALLDRIPRQVKSLHQEVVAQRALDRRLTEELVRFKSSISTLTSDLATLRAHDREVTQQAAEAKNELQEAIEESKKNASLLTEYHELYELQRNRLEVQVGDLTEERDLWGSAAYTLALKVTDKHSLNTAKKLHLCEKAWSKLARHFAVFLSEKDSVELHELTDHVQKWRALAKNINKGIVSSEEEMKRRLQSLVGKLAIWNKEFQKILNYDDGSVRYPNKKVVATLLEDLKLLGKVLSQESERFSGETLLSLEEELYQMNKLVDSWTNVAQKIFNRHQSPDGHQWPQHAEMTRLNGEVDRLHQQYHVKVLGENGVAKGIIDLVYPIEIWISKLNDSLSRDEMIGDSDWFRLGDCICTEWRDHLTQVIDLIGSTLKDVERTIGEVEKKVDFENLVKDLTKWLSATTNGTESEDGRIFERVSIVHSTIIRWMITVLLRLAPDMEDNTLHGIAVEHSEFSVGGGEILLQSTSEAIFSRSNTIFEELRAFTSHLTNCCSALVVDNIQKKHDQGDELADTDFKEFKRLKIESENWIRTAKLLREEVVQPTSFETEEGRPSSDLRGYSAASSHERGEDGPEKTTTESDRSPSRESKPSDDSSQKDKLQLQQEGSQGETADQPSPSGVLSAPDGKEEKNEESEAEQKEDKDKLDESRIHVIGQDENIRTKSLTNLPSDQEAAFLIEPEGETTQAQIPTPDTRKAMEALAAVERLQAELLETEERAQREEERAIQAETELKKALEKIRALERSASRASSTHSAAETPVSGVSKETKPSPSALSKGHGTSSKKSSSKKK